MRRLIFAILSFGSLSPASADQLTSYTDNVLTHVVLHEIGHAVVREFDLPILGNEEVMADAFATWVLTTRFPEQAVEIIKDRMASWRAEGDQTSDFAEHPSDNRRAGQMICLGFGTYPERFDDLARSSGMTGREAAGCRDRAPEIARSWRRIMTSLAISPNVPVTEVDVIFGEGPHKSAFETSQTVEIATEVLRSLDWHSKIRLHFDHCDQGATWSRNGRRILVCDDLVTRFDAQN